MSQPFNSVPDTSPRKEKHRMTRCIHCGGDDHSSNQCADTPQPPFEDDTPVEPPEVKSPSRRYERPRS